MHCFCETPWCCIFSRCLTLTERIILHYFWCYMSSKWRIKIKTYLQKRIQINFPYFIRQCVLLEHCYDLRISMLAKVVAYCFIPISKLWHSGPITLILLQIYLSSTYFNGCTYECFNRWEISWLHPTSAIFNLRLKRP